MSTANSNNIYNTSKSDNIFYVYLHVDPRNDEVFYVGKGQDDRAYKFDKTSRSSYHYRVLNKLYNKLGYTKDDIVHIYKDNLNEQCAFCLERILISKYGRKDLGTGPLLNFTDGGEVLSGRIYSKEERQKMSKIQKEWYKSNPSAKEQISKERKQYFKIHGGPNKGRKWSEETKLKNTLSNCKYLYWYFDEDGNKIEFIFLREFCKENNLNRSGMKTAFNKSRPYKGIQYYRTLLPNNEEDIIKIFDKLSNKKDVD